MDRQKRWLLALVAGLTVAMMATQAADAGGFRGGSAGGQGYGCGNCENYSPGTPPAVDEKNNEASEKFFNETLALRKSLISKYAERNALMRQQNPDPKQAAKLAEELFDLQNELRIKAAEAGISGGGYGCGGPGYGRGPGGY